MFRVHPVQLRRATEARRLKDDPMKTKPFKKYRPNVVEIETTPDERRILDAAHLASDTLRRTFDNWVTMGRGLQLLRKKADLLGTRVGRVPPRLTALRTS
jgi:hypothetical protein